MRFGRAPARVGFPRDRGSEKFAGRRRLHGSCPLERVRRVLLILHGPIDVETIRRRWEAAVADDVEYAVCYQLPRDNQGFRDILSAQRTVTAALREVCGTRAESMAIFAITDRDGDRVEDCAREWGATEVRT